MSKRSKINKEYEAMERRRQEKLPPDPENERDYRETLRTETVDRDRRGEA